jgi:hypothetical protein
MLAVPFIIVAVIGLHSIRTIASAPRFNRYRSLPQFVYDSKKIPGPVVYPFRFCLFASFQLNREGLRPKDECVEGDLGLLQFLQHFQGLASRHGYFYRQLMASRPGNFLPWCQSLQ